MIEQNIKVKMQLRIPIDKPDLNGVMYSKEAIEKALSKPLNGLPLVFRGNVGSDAQVIGVTDGSNYEFDEETQTFIVNIDGMVMYGGADIIANDISRKDGVACVESFEINCIGLSQ